MAPLGDGTDLNPFFERQNEVFGLIKRTIDNLKKMGRANWTRGAVQSRLERLESNWNDFNDIHKKLIPYKIEYLDTVYFKEDTFTLCEDAYLDAKSFMLDLLNLMPVQGSEGSVGQPVNQTVATEAPLIADTPMVQTVRVSSGSRHLPQIHLPTFDGDYANWSQYRDLFYSLVNDNADISDVEKLQYLKMSLVKEPAQLIKNLLVTSANFQRAWNLLIERYENRRVLIDAQLSILFSARSIRNESAYELKRLIGEVKESLGALESLGCPVNMWDHLLVYMLVRKLDAEIVKDWEKSIGHSRDPVPFGDLEEFLVGRVYTLEAIEKLTKSKPQTLSKLSNVKVHNASAPTAGCSLCGGAHYIASCQTFLAKTAAQRSELVLNRGLCFNCLGPHIVRRCRVLKRCRICRKPHHTTLHEAPPVTQAFTQRDGSVQPETGGTSNQQQPSTINAQISTSSHLLHSYHIHTPVILATALIFVSDSRGESIIVRALIDQGSEVSFISESLMQRLRLQRRSASVPISGIGSQKLSISSGMTTVRLCSRTNPFVSFNEETLILPKLTAYLPQKRSAQIPFELTDLPLADPEFTSPRRIELILGVSLFSKILQSGVKRSRDGGLIAQQTSFGWILSGVLSDQPLTDSNPHGFQCSVDREFIDLIQRFWKQEDDSATVPRVSTDERECEEHFVRTHTREDNGRFVVRLPFRRSPSELGVSYPVAIQNFKRLELRFARNEKFKIEYERFINEYIELGHMRCVPLNLNIRNFYLPHHGVIRESSSTTRLRVVFNGSQLTSSGLSLNDCLYTGPKLQTELVDVLLRWRRHPIAIACDLEKMYRQIRLHEMDQPFQRIVWRNNCSQELQNFELTTVTYGLSCAPYLAIRCLRQLASEHSEAQPFGAVILQHDTYVDDILSGADTVDEVQEVIFQLTQVLKAGGFTARKWISNVPAAISILTPDLLAESRTLNIEDDKSPRALGLMWNNASDHFLFCFNNLYDSIDKVNKRTVLSFIARLFDPLGWLSPLIITAKIFMQNLWTRNLEWDQPLPEDLERQWKTVVDDFRGVPMIRVPRWLGLGRSVNSIQLHGFADASTSAYGAVVYLRVFDNEEVRVSVVFSKSKVAPLKVVTIPRLELCACVLLVRLARRVRSALDVPDIPIHLWTDSTVALAWICSQPSKWKDFVRNRVTEIHDLPEAQWRYVPSGENPADFVSRGVPVRQLQEATLWWSGPAWLSSSSGDWPSLHPDFSSESEREKRSTPASHTATPSDEGWNLKHRYSSLNKLLRVTAWCSQIFSKFSYVSDVLTPDEVDRALMFWVQECQQFSFREEIRELLGGRVISRSSPLFRLSPFIDGNGSLRITGRLRFANLDWDEKHPLIIPKRSRITELLIDSHHRRTLHGGTQLTLSSIRRRFWIVGGRVPVRAFIQKCMVCAKQRVVTSQQLMGQLPTPRVTPSRPFLHTGVDYAGPFLLRTFRGRGGKTYKAYLILFVCLATSAVHLELATDYTTSGFMAAYKRFSGRRGISRCLYSDCGTNLVGADRELRSLFAAASKNWKEIANMLVDDGTKWKFNPPAAPHFGGKWEAGVKSVKTHLKRVVGSTLLTYEEFSTILIQIEAVLNSRPLCSLSDDPSSYDVLTPAHFIIGGSLTVVPEPSLVDEKISRLSRWQLLQRMLEDFWNHWQRFYLQSIQNATKWHVPHNLPQIGQLVLIKDERLPPGKWTLARIEKIHYGPDGHARVATLKTPSTTLTRPFVRLCVLPSTE
ncbi:uncharacterized protein [Onthophagus taurus]|uniref:uncharacterized protein n=1 Tax=Onthophagus taurus TaxID=166361 RepID=UPI0039BE61E8